MRKISLLSIVLYVSFFSFSQNYIQPVNIPIQLSANFGELRNNHFHSGLDIKTQGVQIKPVFAVADGYISRINISPGGYGLALYIDHPATGHTTVYGHLNRFSKKIAQYVEALQYQRESFSIDVLLGPDELPVKQGEQIALSGNSGSSGGPHLHFEIRDTATEEPLDALEYLPANISDTRKPEIRGIAVYPINGVVNGTKKPLRMTIGKNKAGVPLGLPQKIEAWGRIGVGVKAYDRMNGQHNIYGVKHVRLFVDDVLIFSSSIRRFSFAQTRMLNSLVDFEDWRERQSFYTRSFVEPGNKLPIYANLKNEGYIDIAEERPYALRYELSDHFGNTLTYRFTIHGKRQTIPPTQECLHKMSWQYPNAYFSHDFTLSIPEGNLYSDFCFSYSKRFDAKYLSDVHHVNNRPVPLHKKATIWLKLNRDTLESRSQYGIVRIDRNGKTHWMGGEFILGGIEANIRELGDTYAVDIDTTPPQIVPQNPEDWIKNRRISIKVTDDKSGVASFRGEINGQYALFTHDVKSAYYIYRFDDKRLSKGRNQTLQFTAIDGAGNRSEFRYKFDY